MKPRDLTPDEARQEIEAFMGEGWRCSAIIVGTDTRLAAACTPDHRIELEGKAKTYRAAVDALAATVAYGDGYREEWSLVIDGVTTVGAREAYVARRALHCPVTQADLESRHPRLATLMGTAASDLQSFVDEAWSACLQKLTSAGRWPESIVEPTSLRGYVQAHALYLIFRSMLTSTQAGVDRYAALAEGYRIEAASLWADVRFRADTDQDGTADNADRRGAAQVVRRAVAGWPNRARRVL